MYTFRWYIAPTKQREFKQQVTPKSPSADCQKRVPGSENEFHGAPIGFYLKSFG